MMEQKQRQRHIFIPLNYEILIAVTSYENYIIPTNAQWLILRETTISTKTNEIFMLVENRYRGYRNDSRPIYVNETAQEGETIS